MKGRAAKGTRPATVNSRIVDFKANAVQERAPKFNDVRQSVPHVEKLFKQGKLKKDGRRSNFDYAKRARKYEKHYKKSRVVVVKYDIQIGKKHTRGSKAYVGTDIFGGGIRSMITEDLRTKGYKFEYGADFIEIKTPRGRTIKKWKIKYSIERYTGVEAVQQAVTTESENEYKEAYQAVEGVNYNPDDRGYDVD